MKKTFVLCVCMASVLLASQRFGLLVGSIALPASEMKDLAKYENMQFQAFSERPAFELVDFEMVQQQKQKFISQLKPKEDPMVLQTIRQHLKSAIQDYHYFKYDEAISKLSLARKGFIEQLHLLRSNRELVETHLYLGMSFVALKEMDQALNEFKRVIHLDSKWELSTKEYSPKIIEVFSKAKQELSQQSMMRLSVLSNQEGASVYINGRIAGQTPLQMELWPGDYFILVEKSGFTNWYELRTLKSVLENVTVTLNAQTQDLRFASTFRTREGKDQESKDIEWLLSFAQDHHADFVLLSRFQSLYGSNRLLGQLFRVSDGAFSNVSMINLVQYQNDASLAFKAMAQNLESVLVNEVKLDAPLGDEYAVAKNADQDNTPVVKKSTPFYKKWWFYPLALGLAGGVVFGVKGLSQSGGSKAVFTVK